MTPEKEAKIRAKYPLVFGGPLANHESFRCDDGWADVIDRLCAKLEPLIAAEPDPDTRDALRAFQVKEKFGGLRFYTWSTTTPAIARAISDAERESEITCEICGAPGGLRKLGPWLLKTLCDACFETESKRYEQP